MSEKKIVVYGTGEEAKRIHDFLSYLGNEDNVISYCYSAEKEKRKENFFGKPVVQFDCIKGKNVTFVIGAKRKDYISQIKEQLENSGEFYYESVRDWLIGCGMDPIEYERNYCAYYHMESMDDYFNVAESESAMNVFWEEGSVFRKYFDKLDLSNVIELACGRGRHVQKYLAYADTVTLVDILQKNIDFCRERYKNCDKIIYYKNNGFNLEKLKSDRYTALFSYDAMVHFEMLDIYEYLKDIYRVLMTGGMALLHHSNMNDYKATFREENNGHARSFMSKELFAYLAYKVGFKLVDQGVIDWGGVRNLDCVTLIMK